MHPAYKIQLHNLECSTLQPANENPVSQLVMKLIIQQAYKSAS